MSPWITKQHKHNVSYAKKSTAAGKAGQAALIKLNSFIDATQAEPCFWLTRMWKNQQKAITYKEIREAILNGYMDMDTLNAWQQDYAVFVSDNLKPLWISSMQEATATITAAHPDFFFDPMQKAAQDWINQRGAEWVTNMSVNQQEAIQAMLIKAHSGDWSVDELSRAIRPVIGLTKTQAIANLTYQKHVVKTLLENHPRMKAEDAEKRAREAAMKYANRQHRARAFTIATTEMAFAYNRGAHEGIKQAQEQGYMGETTKVWSTAADELVCEICGALDGLETALDGEYSFKGGSLFAGQKQTPPAHPNCRCALLYKEKSPPVIRIRQPEDEAEPPEEVPDPMLPVIPKSIKMPKGMKHQGRANLGGTGVMHRYIDDDGQEWLFKTAQSKGGVKEPFRAYVQEAGYKVQNIIDPDSTLPIGIGDLDGRFGTFQKRIKTIGDIDLHEWQYAQGNLPPEIVRQLQREHVTDWIMCNFDSHGRNFILDDVGRVIGVDKEQSFRYIKNIASHKMNYAYHPNAVYHETEPIYNTMHRLFAKGTLDLSLQDTLTYIKRIETIPDSKYREIFREYAEELRGKGSEAEALLDSILERKTGLREEYRRFYSELLTERTGKKQAFIWADEAIQHMQQPLAGIKLSVANLDKMSVAELKQIGKQKQIPYYNNMNKKQLVTAISDPVKAPEMSEQVRARLAAAQKARVTASAISSKEKSMARATDVFSDLSTVPESRIGIPVHSDADMLEGLNLAARRINIDGDDYYEISGKLTETAWRDTWKRIKPHGTIQPLKFEKADDITGMFRSSDSTSLQDVKSMVVHDSAGSFEMYIEDAEEKRGWEGYFRARVRATGHNTALDASNMKQLFENVGLQGLMKNPTQADELIFKKNRLVWQHAPGRMWELKGLTGKQKADKLDEILRDIGINEARIKNLKLEKVFDGYATYIDEAVANEYANEGLRYVWSGVNDSDAVISILQNGLIATNNRFVRGMNVVGASIEDDILTGGSDNVFTRIGIQDNYAFSNSMFGSRYRVIVDPKVMRRTDWYAYNSDSYGTTIEEELFNRPTAREFIKTMNDSYNSSNEIMFRRGIAKENIIGVSCQEDHLRARLLNELRSKGITEVNGIPVDKFVKTTTKLNQH